MSSSTPPADRESLRARTLRTDYVTRVSEVVRDMQFARDQAQAVELLQEATVRMGAEVSIFASFIRDDETCRSYRLLLACDPAWFTEYERTGRYDDDPWLAYAQRHSVPIRSSEITIATAAERAAVELTQRFGFRSAVIVPAPSSGGLSRTGVLCLGSSKPDYFDDEGYVTLKVVARGVAMELHEWWLGRLRDELITTSSITDEDLLLLAHERLGHSTKTIAKSLGWTTSSVDSRFQRVNVKLRVANRKAAARLAAEYGLI